MSKFSSNLNNSSLKTSFHALTVVDAKSGKTLYDLHGDKYFIPASNVKIFTLFASKKLLPKKAPALYYQKGTDTLYVEGTGYPATLHPYFMDSTAISFLRKSEVPLAFKSNCLPKYGPGWAWEDYDRYFSPEINDFPLYGNVLTVFPKQNADVIPYIFADSINYQHKPIRRKERSNQFYVRKYRKDTLSIPFISSPKLTITMLGKALGKKVWPRKKNPRGEKKILPGIDTDSILKRMMYVSDNFLAEQLLVMSSSAISDTLDSKKTISHILKHELKDMEHSPRWVDGSGLSRYNLFTPNSMVHVLRRLHQEIPEEKLFALFPSWNRNGTQSIWKDPERPRYLFAKSGAMGNTYNLSGYLRAKSGRLLIFSSMNNHFRVPSAEVRKEIELILESLWEQY